MAKIRDTAVTIYAATTASMVCNMPVHATGDLLLAFVNKDSTTGFGTPAGWTLLQSQDSAGAHGAVYAKRAASASETVTFTLTLETCLAVLVSIRNCNGTTVADAVSDSTKTGADDSTLPLAGVTSFTPSFSNSLLFSWLSSDSGFGPSALPGWINMFVGDTGANSGCLSYTYQKTAASISHVGHWGALADDTRAFMVAVRDNGSETEVDAYLDRGTTPAILLMPFVAASPGDAGTWIAAASTAITNVGGKTVSGVTIAAAADSGYNPFRAAARNAGASSTTNLAHTEFTPTAAFDMTQGSGVLFGTWRPQLPRDYLDLNKAGQGGVYFLIAASGTPASNYSAWEVGAQFSKTTKPSDRQNFAIQIGQTSDTRFANAGTVTASSVARIAIGSSGYYGAASVEWSDLYMLNESVLAGGRPSNPIGFDDIVSAVNNGNGFLPVIEKSGAAGTIWTRLKFGGGDPCHVLVNLRTFQYPRKADEASYLDFHVDNNHLGIEFYGKDRGSGDVDTLKFTNSVFTSDSPYYWRFNASHAAGATLDFAGTSVVNATVTLRSTVSLTSVTFIDCPTFTQNAATLASCRFQNTKVTSAAPGDADNITNSTFVSSGTGHAIEIGGTAANITLTGLVFTGYAGTNGSTGNEAIYVNIATGSMTISISGGGSTPSIRTAGCVVTVTNSVTVKVTAKDADTSAAIQSARVLLYASTGTTVTITRSGSTATVAHTAHGYQTGQKVFIGGANEGEYNGIKSITYIDANSYSFTVSGTPTTPATGTITSYRVILDGDTDSNGVIQDTGFAYVSNIAVTGRVRKGTSSTYYKTAPVSGTITTAGFDSTAFLVRD